MASESQEPKKGRGTGLNPGNRFSDLEVGPEEFDENSLPESTVATRFIPDSTRSILAKNNSPDICFTYSVNPYRGCEHGCVYCYARPTHEYLGLSAGVDFETQIFVKESAPELLRKELNSPKWVPQSVTMSGVTDCYQPVERKLRLTRGCLEVFAEFMNPVSLITKNHGITRDIDVLQRLAKNDASLAILSITTLDADLCATLEPRTSRPQARLKAIEELAASGIPVGVNVAPVIPGLTDEELPAILKAAFDAGAQFAGYVPLRLPFAVKDLFEEWIHRAYPTRANKVLNRIREMRGGKLNDSNFGSRMKGEGVFAQQIESLFRISAKKIGIPTQFPTLSTKHFRRKNEQLQLFGF
jgi:DNA repair photolyase